jgi:metal-dependent amidase/aminoacylase/carboxypeptidase family protein
MAVWEGIGLLRRKMAERRHDIHARPETAVEEQRTAALMAKKLGSFGLCMHPGLGRAEVVGQGLFERFPRKSAYATYHWPGMPVGQFGVRPGRGRLHAA